MNPYETDDFDAEGPREGLPAPLRDPLGTLRRRWPWMLAALAVGASVSVSAWYLSAPRYYAEVSVVVSRQQMSENLVRPTIQDDALTRMDALAAEVLSAVNLGALVEEFDLYSDLRDSESLSEIVARVRANVTIEAQEKVDKRSQYSSSRVYTIGYESEDREATAGVANGIAKLFVESSIENRHRQHQLATGFLRRELESAERELREHNRAIAGFKQENRGLLPNDALSNLKRVDDLRSQRAALKLEIAEAEARAGTGTFVDPSSGDSELAALRAELRRLLSSSTEKHPDVVTLRKQIAGLEAELELPGAAGQPSPPAPLSAATERTLEVLRERLAATEAELAELDDRFDRMPAVQEELAALEQKAMILQETYLEFLRKLQDAKLAEELVLAQQGERISVLSPAEPPKRPTNKRGRLLVLGLLVSFGLACGIAFTLEMLDPVLVSADQIEHAWSLPVLGSVGRIR